MSERPRSRAEDPLNWDNLRVPLAVMASLAAAAGAVLLSATVDSDLLARVLMPCGLIGFLLPLWAVAVPASRRDARTIFLVVVAVIALVVLETLFGTWDVSGLGFVLACVAVMALHLRRRRHPRDRSNTNSAPDSDG